MSIPAIIILGVLILAAYLAAMGVVRAKTKALAYYRECGDLWRAEATKPWHLRDYGKVYEYINGHPSVRDKLMKQYFTDKVLSENFDLYRLACQRLRDRDDIAAAFYMIMQWRGVPIYEAEVKRLVSKMNYFLPPSSRMTSVLRRLDMRAFLDNIRSPAYIGPMRQFLKDLFSTWEAAGASFAEGNFKTAYGHYILADKTEDWMRFFRESLIFTAVVDGGDSQNYSMLLDIYTRYFDVLPEAKRGVRLSASVHNTDCIIAKCFATFDGTCYNAGRMQSEAAQTLDYLIEYETCWEDALTLSEAFRYMEAYGEEKTVLSQLRKKRVPIGDAYEERFQNLLRGITSTENETDETESDETAPDDDGENNPPAESDEAEKSPLADSDITDEADETEADDIGEDDEYDDWYGDEDTEEA